MKKISLILIVLLVISSCASKKASCDAYGLQSVNTSVSDSAKK